MKRNLGLLILASVIAVMPFASAYWNGLGFGYGFSPSDLLDNEWAVFLILFAIFYSTIYASLGKVFKDNKAAPAIIALALALLVTAGIQKQWTFLEQPIMLWALILAVVLVLVTFFRAMNVGPVMFIGVFLLLAGLWGSIKDSIGYMLPYAMISFFDSLQGFAWAIIIAGLVFISYGFVKTHSAREK
ncbi:MAG: hypothetical protein V1886_01670 [archaeon]